MYIMDKKEIEKLANLARIKISPSEKQGFFDDLKTVLSYVSEIEEVGTKNTISEAKELKNVFREDSLAHESGLYTESIMEEIPKKEKGYLKVKKILQV